MRDVLRLSFKRRTKIEKLLFRPRAVPIYFSLFLFSSSFSSFSSSSCSSSFFHSLRKILHDETHSYYSRRVYALGRCSTCRRAVSFLALLLFSDENEKGAYHDDKVPTISTLLAYRNSLSQSHVKGILVAVSLLYYISNMLHAPGSTRTTRTTATETRRTLHIVSF